MDTTSNVDQQSNSESYSPREQLPPIAQLAARGGLPFPEIHNTSEDNLFEDTDESVESAHLARRQALGRALELMNAIDRSSHTRPVRDAPLGSQSHEVQSELNRLQEELRYQQDQAVIADSSVGEQNRRIRQLEMDKVVLTQKLETMTRHVTAAGDTIESQRESKKLQKDKIITLEKHIVSSVETEKVFRDSELCKRENERQHKELEIAQASLVELEHVNEIQRKDLFALVPVSRAVKEENDKLREQAFVWQQRVSEMEADFSRVCGDYEAQIEDLQQSMKEIQQGGKFSVLPISNEIDSEAIHCVSVFYQNNNTNEDNSKDACDGQCSKHVISELQDKVSELEIQKGDLAQMLRTEQERGRQHQNQEQRNSTLQRQLLEQERHLKDVLVCHQKDLDQVHDSLQQLTRQQRACEQVWKRGLQAIMSGNRHNTEGSTQLVTSINRTINNNDLHHLLQTLDAKLSYSVQQQIPQENTTITNWVTTIIHELEAVFKHCTILRTGLQVQVSGFEHLLLEQNTTELSFEQGTKILIPLLRQQLSSLQECGNLDLAIILRSVVCEMQCRQIVMYQARVEVEDHSQINASSISTSNMSHDSLVLQNRIAQQQAKLTTMDAVKHDFDQAQEAYGMICTELEHTKKLVLERNEDISVLSSVLQQSNTKNKQQEDLNLQLRTSMNVGADCKKCQHDKMYRLEENDSVQLLKSEVSGQNDVIKQLQCEKLGWSTQLKKVKEELSKQHNSSRGYREQNSMYSSKVAVLEQDVVEKNTKIAFQKQQQKLKENRVAMLQAESVAATNQQPMVVVSDNTELEARVKTLLQANNRKNNSIVSMKEKLSSQQSKQDASEAARAEKEQLLAQSLERSKVLQASISSLEVQQNHVKQTLAGTLGSSDGTLRGAQGDQDHTIQQLRGDLDKERKKSRSLDLEVRLLSSRSPLALRVQAQRSGMHSSRVTEQKTLAVQHRMQRLSQVYSVVVSTLTQVLSQWVWKHCNLAYGNSCRKAQAEWTHDDEGSTQQLYADIHLVHYVMTELTNIIELAKSTKMTEQDVSEYIRWFGGNQQPVQLKQSNENNALLWFVKTNNCRQIEHKLLNIVECSTDTQLQCQLVWFICQVQPEIDVESDKYISEIDTIQPSSCSYLPLGMDAPVITAEQIHAILTNTNVDAPLNGVDILALTMCHKTQWRLDSLTALARVLHDIDADAAVKAEKQGHDELLALLQRCRSFGQESTPDLQRLQHVLGAYTSDDAGAVSVEHDGRQIVDQLLPCNGLQVLEDGIYIEQDGVWLRVADRGVVDSVLHLQDWQHCVSQTLQSRDMVHLFDSRVMSADSEVDRCISDTYEQGKQAKYLHALYILEKLHGVYQTGKCDRVRQSMELQISDKEQQHNDLERQWKTQEARYRHACAKQHNIIQSCGSCHSKEKLRLHKNEQMLVDDCEHVWSSESECVCSDCLAYKQVTLKMMQTDIEYGEPQTGPARVYSHEEKKQQLQEQREVADLAVQLNSFSTTYKSPKKESAKGKPNTNSSFIEEEDAQLFELNPTLGEVSVMLDITQQRTKDVTIPVQQPPIDEHQDNQHLVEMNDEQTEQAPHELQNIVLTRPVRQQPSLQSYSLKLSLPRGQK